MKNATPHTCFTKINKELRENNAELDTVFQFNFTGKAIVAMPQITLIKLDRKSRKPLPTVVPTYCPFCGKKL